MTANEAGRLIQHTYGVGRAPLMQGKLWIALDRSSLERTLTVTTGMRPPRDPRLARGFFFGRAVAFAAQTPDGRALSGMAPDA